MKLKHIFPILLITLCGFTACEKTLEVDTPVNQLVSIAIFKDSLTAQAAMNGVYSLMYNGTSQAAVGTYGLNTTFLPAKSADEIYLPNSAVDEFVSNSITPANSLINAFWVDSYKLIYAANSIIEGMEGSSLSPTLKIRLINEAKFIRAFCHFTLTNYFGDVPLITTTNVTVNNSMPRVSSELVYAQVISDLQAARNALGTDYSWSQNNRTRANKWVATALLARVYLYHKEWANAESMSSAVISQSQYSLPELGKAFLISSPEAIFQFYTNLNGYTFVGNTLLPVGTIAPVNVITPQLKNAFETGDQRSTVWMKTYTNGTIVYPYASKYTTRTAGSNTEYDVVMRLGEQYLIRAEARAQLNNLTQSADDLNVIRKRAGLGNTTSVGQTGLLDAILHERQVELFTEWGHRWLDLKRTGKADQVLSVVKGTAAWQSTDVLYPISTTVLLNNPAIVQNNGYN